MADQQPQSTQPAPQSKAQGLTRVSDKASTFLNSEGQEVFIDEDLEVTEGAAEEADEDDTDLVELPDIEEPLVEELPPEDELPPEEVKLDEKFAAYFEKSTGMPMAEFGATMLEIKTVVKEIGAEGLKEGIAFIRASRIAQQIEEVRSEADKLWNVDRAETNKRLEVIKPYFDRLPEKDKKLYDNPVGADILWRSVKKQTGGAKTSTSKGTTSPTGKRFLYSQSEIDAMSREEYETHADRITAAYNKNLVGE